MTKVAGHEFNIIFYPKVFELCKDVAERLKVHLITICLFL